MHVNLVGAQPVKYKNSPTELDLQHLEKITVVTKRQSIAGGRLKGGG